MPRGTHVDTRRTWDSLAACLLDQAGLDLMLVMAIRERQATARYVGPRDPESNPVEPFNLDHYTYSGVDEPTP